MANVTVYFLNTAATTPNWFGKVQDDGVPPAGALSAFGWTVAKISTATPYWRGRLGATARSTTAQAASWIAAQTGPVQGTGNAATTAGDSFRSDNPLTGAWAAGNWNFTFGMRTGAATHSGRVRLRMWASTNASGAGARELTSAVLVGSIVTLNSTTTTFNSTVTWAAPEITLNNEYVFTQIEWQTTTAGTSNSCTTQFYQASFVTTNWSVPIADAWNISNKIDVSLSNADKTATLNVGTTAYVKSTTTHLADNTGKRYAEFYFPNVLTGGGASQRVGLDTPAGGFGNANSFLYYSNGDIYFSQSTTGINIGAITSGDTICLAWDEVNGQSYFRKNAGPWNGSGAADPSANTGGHNLSVPTNTVYALLFGAINAATGNCTIRTEAAEFAFTPPAGFLSWMGEAIPVADAWNAGDRGGPLYTVLSDNDKTITSTASNGTNQVRSTKSYTAGVAGLYYAEIVIAALPGNWVEAGVVQKSNAIEATTTLQTGCFSIQADLLNGYFLANDGTTVATNASPASASVVLCIAYNSATNTGWLRVDNGLWNFNVNANPVTGVGGIAITASGEMCLIGKVGSGTGQSLTVRTEKDEFTQTTPSGYLSWMGETLVIPDIGTLASGSATLAGAGVTHWAGTGALVAQASTIAGVGVVPLVDAWSRADKSTDFTLSNGDKTATLSAGVTSGVRSTTRYLNGTETRKFYVEFVLTNAIAGFSCQLGVREVGVALNTSAGSTFQVATNSGNIVIGSSTTVGNIGGAPLLDGDVVCMAWIPSTERGWFRKNGGLWNNDPAANPSTNTNGFDISALNNTDHALLFLAASSLNGASVTVRTEAAELTYLTPFDFVSWMGEPLAFVTREGTGALATETSTVAGAGIARWVGTGTLTSTPSVRTNLMRYSQEFDQAAWNKGNVNVAANQGINAPDSTVTSEELRSNASSAQHLIFAAFGAPEAGAYTFSVYARYNMTSWVQLHLDSGRVNFNVFNGLVGIQNGAVGTITALPQGWFRCTVTKTGIPIGSVNAQIALIQSDIDSLPSFTNSNVSVLIWGAQVETGAVATEYIPTTTATASSLPNTLVASGAASWNATGALITGARTNMLRRSQELDISSGAVWQRTAVTLTANATTAPDSTATADRLEDTGTTAEHYIYQSFIEGTVVGLTYTASVYAKAGTLSWTRIYISHPVGYWANFDLANGLVGLKSATGTASIVPVGDGWYRCSVTTPPAVSAGGQIILYALASDVTNGEAYTGAGGYVYLWGAQAEVGGIATAYISTTTAPVTAGTPALITGVGESGWLPITGTAVLASASSAVAGAGVAQWVGTGALTAVGATRVVNLLLFSDEFENAYWTPSQVTVAANAVAAPDSTMTADTLTSAIASNRGVYPSSALTVENGQTYTASFYAKAGIGRWIQWYDFASFRNFDLVNGVVGSNFGGAGITTTITDAGNGWWRCSATYVSPAIVRPQVYLCDDDSAIAGGGSGQTLSLHLWGFQLEKASTAGPYVRSGATAGGIDQTLVGTGTASWNASGVLVVGTSALITGAGDAVWPPVVGTGALTSDVADLDALGDTLSVGTGGGGAIISTGVGPGSASYLGTATSTKYSQNIFSQGTLIRSVQTWLTQVGASVCGNVLVKLHAVDGGHLPTTLLATSNTLLPSTSIPTTGQTLYTFVFDPPLETTIGVELSVVIETETIAPGNANCLYGYIRTPSTYANAQWRWFDGAAWRADFVTYDVPLLVDQTFAGGLKPLAATLTGAGVSQSVSTATALVAGGVGDSSTIVLGAYTGPAFSVGTTGQKTVAQSFVSVGTTIESIAINFALQGAPVDGLVAKVFTDAANYPGVQIGATSDTVVPTGGGALATFTFTTPVAVAVGTTYWIKIERLGAVNGTAYYYVGASNTFPNSRFVYQLGNDSWSDYNPPGSDVPATIVQTGGSTAVRIVSTGAVEWPPIVGTGTLASDACSAIGAGLSSSAGASERFPSIAIDGTRTDTPFGLSTGTRVITQTFLALGNAITSLDVFISKTGAPSDSLRARIITADAGHKPTGVVLGTSTFITAASLPTGATVARTFVFSAPALVTMGVEYVLQIDRTSTLNDTNRYNIAVTTDTFAGGQYGYSTSGGFFLDPARDLVVTIKQIEGGLFAQSALVVSSGLPSWAGVGTLMPQAQAVSVIDQGATTHIDFVHGPIGYVQGVGNVGIETLLGTDPVAGTTTYYPDAITQYGYDWNGLAKPNPPAAIGALRTAVMRGDSLVVKMQSRSDVTSQYVTVTYKSADALAQIFLYNGTRGKFQLDTANGGIILPNCWPEIQSYPETVSTFGIAVLHQSHVDLAVNNLTVGTDPLDAIETPTASPMAALYLALYSPISSITTYPTLPLAELKAKTAQLLDRPSDVGPLIGFGIVEEAAQNKLIAQDSTLAGVGISESRQTLAALSSSIAAAVGTGSTFFVVTAASLTVTAPTIGTPALKKVLTATDLVSPVPIIGLPTLTKALSGANLATGPPALAAGPLTQKHVLNTGPLAVLAPSHSAVVMGQAGVMAGMPIAVGIPAIGVGTLAQRHALAAAVGLPGSPPSIGQADYGRVITATSIAVVAPTLGTPALKKVLTATGFAAPVPVLGTPALSKTLTAVSLAPVPAIGTGLLVQKHVLAGIGIAVVAPTYSAVVLGQAGIFAAMPLVAGQPIFSVPLFGQRHVLATPTLAVTPTIGAAAIAQRHVLAPASLAASAPAIGASSIKQAHTLATSALATSAPTLGAALLRQANLLTAIGFTVAIPTVNITTFGQRHLVAAVTATAGVPSVGSSALGKVLQAAALAVSAPVLTAPQPSVVLPAALPLTAGVPVLGTPACAAVIRPPTLETAAPVFSVPALVQVQRLTAVKLTTAPPELAAPSSSLNVRRLTAAWLTTGAPSLGAAAFQIGIKFPRAQSTYAGRFKGPAAVLGQTHRLTALAASAGALQAIPAKLTPRNMLGTAGPAIAGSPALGAPLMRASSRLVPMGIRFGYPLLGAPGLAQRHVLAARDLVVAGPQLQRPRVAEERVLPDPIGVATDAPVLGAPALAQRMRLYAVTINGRRPVATIEGQRDSQVTIVGRSKRRAAI